MSPVETLSPPWAGLDLNSAPYAVGKTKGQILRNMLPGRPGKVVMRGPLRESVAMSASGWLRGGLWTFDDRVLATPRAGAGYPATAYWASADDLTSTANFAIATPKELTPAYCRLANNVYGMGMPAPAAPAGLSRALTFTSNNWLLRWNGGATAADLVQLANAPGGVDVASHLSRLFVLSNDAITAGGLLVPGNNGAPVIYFSDPGGATADLLTEWIDDVSGLPNRINLEGGLADPGVALARLPASLLVLRRRSLNVLRGDQPANWVLRRVASIGCVDQRSVVEHDDGVFFMSDEGFMSFDGANLRNVSADVNPTLLSWVAGGYNTQTQAVQLPGGYVMVNVLQFAGGLDAAPTPVFCALYHIGTGTWCTLTVHGDRIPGGAPLALGLSSNYPLLWGSNGRLWRAIDVGIPEGVAVANRGLDNDGSGSSPIDISVLTRLGRLSMDGSRSQLKRLLAAGKLKSTTAGRWSLVATLETETGPGLGTVTLLGNTTGDPVRESSEVFAEADAVRVRWSLVANGAVEAVHEAEIHDAWVEHFPAQERPG